MIDRFDIRARGFPATLTLLQGGEMREAQGLLPWGSNYTFLMSVCYGSEETLAIYKPRRGERPLWDFPEGSLCQRELSAFVVSETLGLHIIPPTVLRSGPQGFGMVQQYIEHDPDQHYFTFGPEQAEQLRVIALFDYIVNNADRKAGHCLLDAQGDIWAIDHGICFHVQPKLRTVIWDFAGQLIPPAYVGYLAMFLGKERRKRLVRELSPLLTQGEIAALFNRTESLVQVGRFPEAGPGRQYPWPPI